MKKQPKWLPLDKISTLLNEQEGKFSQKTGKSRATVESFNHLLVPQSFTFFTGTVGTLQDTHIKKTNENHIHPIFFGAVAAMIAGQVT